MMKPSLFYNVAILLLKLLYTFGERDGDNEKESTTHLHFNFASQSAGAVILDKSPASAKGFQNLLDDNKDRYGISPCSENKWVVLGLSEDIVVTSVVLANYEKYSSMLREFQLMGSTKYPAQSWINLGNYEALPKLGEQTFHIPQSDSLPHTRYLKFKFLTHHGNDELCTLSQIKVHGTTVIASFHQEVKRSETLMRDMLNQLNSEAAGMDSIVIPQAEVASADTHESAPNETVDGSKTSAVIENASTTFDTKSEESLNHPASGLDEECLKVDAETVILHHSSGTDQSGASIAPTVSNHTENSTNNHLSENEPTADPSMQNIVLSGIQNLISGILGGASGSKVNVSGTVSLSSKNCTVSSNIDDSTLVENNVSGYDEIETHHTSDLSVEVDERKSDKVDTAEEFPNMGIDRDVAVEAAHVQPKVEPSTIPAVNLRNVGENDERVVASLTSSVDKAYTEDQPQASEEVVAPVLTTDQCPNELEKSVVVSLDAAPLSDADLIVNTSAVLREAVEDVFKVAPSVQAVKPVDQVAQNTSKLTIEVVSAGEAIAYQASSENSTSLLSVAADQAIQLNTQLVINTDNLNIAPDESETCSFLAAESATECGGGNDNGKTNTEGQIISDPGSADTTNQTTERSAAGKSSSSFLASSTSDANISVTDGTSLPVSDTAKAASTVDTANATSHQSLLSSSDGSLPNVTSTPSPQRNNSITANATVAVVSTSNISLGINGSLIGPNGYHPCLDAMKFQDFKAKMEAKLSFSGATGTHGQQDSKDKDHEHGENVFYQLMQKIKSLEMNYAIIDMYMTQSNECYRAVLMDASLRSTVLTSSFKRQESQFMRGLEYQRNFTNEMTQVHDLITSNEYLKHIDTRAANALIAAKREMEKALASGLDAATASAAAARSKAEVDREEKSDARDSEGEAASAAPEASTNQRQNGVHIPAYNTEFSLGTKTMSADFIGSTSANQILGFLLILSALTTLTLVVAIALLVLFFSYSVSKPVVVH